MDTGEIELNVEDVESQKMPGRWLLWVLAVVLALVVVVLGLYITSKFVAFQPLTVYDYTVSPTEVCPFDRLNIVQDLGIEDRWYYSLDNLEGETYSLDPKDKPYGGTMFDVAVEAIPRAELPSNTVRLAPPEANEWRSAGKGTLHGKMFGLFSVAQYVPEQVSNAYTVLPFDSEKCAEKFSYYLEQG